MRLLRDSRRVVLFSIACWLAAGAGQTPPASPFAPLASGASWTYKLTFPKAGRIPLDVEWVGMEGLIGTSVTHGMRDVKEGTTQVTMSIGEVVSPDVAKATVSRDLTLLFFGPEITESRLMLVSRDKTTLLQLHGHVAMKDPSAKPMVLAQTLAVLPGEPSGPITVPAGTFRSVVHSRIKKPAAGSYTVAHTIDAWLARGIGLVKMVVSSEAGEPFYTLELQSSTVK